MPGRSIMRTLRPSGNSAMPVCCSTVTPGKLASFCRIPVSRLNNVVLPEFGGPTSATALGSVADGGKSSTGVGPHDRQSPHWLIWLLPLRLPGWADFEPLGSLTAEGDFRSVHLEHTRVAAGGALACADGGARKKSEFHQAARVIARQIDLLQHSRIASAKVNQRRGEDFRLAVVDTQLHLDFSMLLSEIFVNRRRFFLAL